MQYANGRLMKVGDEVIVDGMTGVIVCDFYNQEFVSGYEHLNPSPVDTTGSDIPSTGVMVKTIEAGLIHYGEETWDMALI